MQMLRLLCFLLLFPGTLQADWSQVQQLTAEGKYPEAIQALQALPQRDATYYYNLGSLHLRASNLGLAVAYLEKADRMSGFDPDVHVQLKEARTALGKKLGADRLDPASSWVESLSDRIPLEELRAILGLLTLVLCVFWARRYTRSWDLKGTLLHPTGILTCFALVVTILLFLSQRLSESYRPAVCVDSQIVRSGPGDQYLELARVEPGIKLRLTKEVTPGKDWYQVRYSQEGIGWLPAASLLTL